MERAWLGLARCAPVVLVAGLAAVVLDACGDDSGPGIYDPPNSDGGDDGGLPEGGGVGGEGGSGGGTGGRGPQPTHDGGSDSGLDGSMDGMVFEQPPDAGCDINTGDCEPPLPEAWSCPDAFWTDGICDCGCSVADFDCVTSSCIEPGCVDALCGACFTVEGSWKPCEPAPDMAAWTCNPLYVADGLCDCGCGFPDPACDASGCDTPACRRGKCDRRHGCAGSDGMPGNGDDVTDPLDDDCSTVNPDVLTSGRWKCAWDEYGGGDGCDCGCGDTDPDCELGGCTAGGCHDAECVGCHDEDGRPFDCAAAAAGWTCNTTRYGTDDGCDCGCGAADPDCNSKGCSLAGCGDADCDRCTDMSTGLPTGCAPGTWTDGAHKCDPDNYGMADGCDCGCGVKDPDCGSGEGCLTPGCTAAGCDVCNDGAGFYVACGGWTCGTVSDPEFANAECDCGCGVVDPYCREVGRVSCTADGCETPVCEYCNDDGTRSTCGGTWEGDNGPDGSACDTEFYALDGLCDCGCGARDPDCPKGKGCTERGCNASGCDVCHEGSLTIPCLDWTCDANRNGSGGKCDCGCGAPDPDCGNGGCIEPGCGDAECDVCHDPAGREVACP